MDTIHSRKDGGIHRPRTGERVMIEVLPSGEAYPGGIKAADDVSSVVVSPENRGRELPPLGSAVRITYVRKDGLYEWTGAVTHLAEGPPPTITVALAGETVRTQRRDHARTDASLNADVEISGQQVRCVTKDVSGGGVSLLFRELPAVIEGQEFAIVLNVPDGRLPIHGRCQVKFVREVLRGSRWLIGSQFVSITEDDRQRLVRFVFRLTLMHGRPR